jgi:hypothetical protein
MSVEDLAGLAALEAELEQADAGAVEAGVEGEGPLDRRPLARGRGGALAAGVADLEGGDQHVALGEVGAEAPQRAREALGVVAVAVGQRVRGGEEHAQRRVARAASGPRSCGSNCE